MGRILIIDDCESTLILLHRTLRDAGYEVEQASGGKDGLAKLCGTERYDLVIVDYLMPDMDGIRMLQQATKLLGKLPFIAFVHTAETSPAIKAQGKSLGVKVWVSKPFNQSKLIDAIKIATFQGAA